MKGRLGLASVGKWFPDEYRGGGRGPAPSDLCLAPGRWVEARPSPPLAWLWLCALLSWGLGSCFAASPHRLFPQGAQQAADEGLVGGGWAGGADSTPLLMAGVVAPGAENSTHTRMEGTGGPAVAGVGGADVSEQVVWRAGRRAGLCESSAGPTQHGSKWPAGDLVAGSPA